MLNVHMFTMNEINEFFLYISSIYLVQNCINKVYIYIYTNSENIATLVFSITTFQENGLT